MYLLSRYANQLVLQIDVPNTIGCTRQKSPARICASQKAMCISQVLSSSLFLLSMSLKRACQQLMSGATFLSPKFFEQSFYDLPLRVCRPKRWQVDAMPERLLGPGSLLQVQNWQIDVCFHLFGPQNILSSLESNNSLSSALQSGFLDEKPRDMRQGRRFLCDYAISTSRNSVWQGLLIHLFPCAEVLSKGPLAFCWGVKKSAPSFHVRSAGPPTAKRLPVCRLGEGDNICAPGTPNAKHSQKWHVFV